LADNHASWLASRSAGGAGDGRHRRRLIDLPQTDVRGPRLIESRDLMLASDRSRSAFFTAGVAATAFATIALELLLTRIYSVTMYYHFAFMVISLALLGLAASPSSSRSAPCSRSTSRCRARSG
jgi:hypothetical protein